MQNSDFRSLLGRKREAAKGVKAETEEERKARESLRQQKKLASYERWQARKKALQEKYAAKTQYRDRARERRENKTTAVEDAEMQRIRELSAEKTRFLGGDMDHTHLVRGLDYALLKRKREELADRDSAQLEAAYEAASQRTTAGAGRGKAVASGSSAPTDFETHIGRAVYRAAILQPRERARASRSGVVDTFVLGRMSYEFDLDPDFGAETPTVVMHSIDIDQAENMRPGVTGMTSPDAARRIERAMRLLREGSRSRGLSSRVVKEENALSQTPAKAAKPDVGVDDDIFADVGDDYVPTADKSGQTMSDSYFGNKAAVSTAVGPQLPPVVGPQLPPVVGPQLLPPMEGPQLPPEPNRQYTDHASRTRKQEGRLQGLAPLESNGDYMECYPTTYSSLDPLGEGEESDGPGTESGAPASGSAPAQGKDGAKRRAMVKEARELDRELSAINKILEQKKGVKRGRRPREGSAKRHKILRGFVSR